LDWADSDISTKYNFIAIAIVREEDTIISPTKDQSVHHNDLLVMIGGKENLGEISNKEES
jgi:K+/H+ antiporter YhaU regulatory subunit KhtT